MDVPIGRSSREIEFSALVRNSRVALLRTASLLTAGDRFLAEDVVQVALARVYASWSRVRDPSDAEAYARRAVVTAFLDERRRPWRRRESTTEEVPDVRAPDAHHAHVDLPYDAATIRHAVAGLAPRMRAVVVLRHALDLSIEATAHLLGCATGTVKSLDAAARARLRASLGAAPTVPSRSDNG